MKEVDNEVEAHLTEMSSTLERIRDDGDYYGEGTVENLGYVIRDARNLRIIVRRKRLSETPRSAAEVNAADKADEVTEPILVEIREAVDFLCINDDNGDAINCCTEMIDQIEKLRKILSEQAQEQAQLRAAADAMEAAEEERAIASDKKRKHAVDDAVDDA